LQFPRDGATEVPEDIVRACYEEAQSLISGKNPSIELENLAMNSDGAGSTRHTYDRSHNPARHLVNGITSFTAWTYIQPFLADVSTFEVVRK
jgi:hypothetical protein